MLCMSFRRVPSGPALGMSQGYSTSWQLGTVLSPALCWERQPTLSQTSPLSATALCGDDGDTTAGASSFGDHGMTWPVGSPGLSQSAQGASATSRAIPVTGFTIGSDHTICCSLW